MEMEISARTVHAVLQALQETSGPQYQHLLAGAGWARFQGAIPPQSAQRIATRTELENLFTHVYTLLGEGLTRLFLRNYGQFLAAQMFAQPAWPAIRTATTILPATYQLTAFVQMMVRMSTRDWTPATLTEDDQAYYVTFERCPMCAGIHNAQAPICAAVETLCGQLAPHLLRRRLRVVEVECAATGAPHCKVALYK